MGDNLDKKNGSESLDPNVVIKEEPFNPSSPTQTVLQGHSGGGSPNERCNIRLRPLKTLTTPTSGSNVGVTWTEGDHQSSSSLALVPSTSSSSSQPQLCGWREWRHQCRGRSIRDKLLFALEHQSFYKDVTLIVGKECIERISAHKLILRLGSPVLENIMEGLNGSSDWRTSDPGAITDILEIPEVEPFAFRHLIKFMYTDDFSTDSLKCSDIMVILQAARRFQIQDLVMLCVQALKTHINDEYAIRLCEMGQDVEDFELRDMAIQYICRNPKKIFYSSNFMDLSYKNLVLLVEQDNLDCDEIQIFKSVLRWADEFCRRRGLEPVASNLRGALGEIIYRIRFPLMSPETFTFEVLTSEEQVQVFKYLCLSDTSAREQLEPTSFNCKRRSYKGNTIDSKFKDEDSGLMKIKSASPHRQLSLASTSTADFTEPESEDTSSQVSSCVSALSTKKRRRSPSPMASPTHNNKKHSSLFGNVAPKRGKLTKRKSIELENTIEIDNGEIELNQFIDECSNNPRRKEIESIKLCGVVILDHSKIQGKKVVRFPKLRDFQLDIKIPSFKHKDVNNLAGEISIEDYLFFTIKVGKKWSLSEIWALNINISFIINGITLLKVNHTKKSVTVNKVKDCSKILSSFDDASGIRSLVISYPSFPGNVDAFPTQSLDRLVLLRMDKIPEFNAFIRKFKRLKELCILSSDTKIVDLSRDFKSHDKLRKLSLGSANFSSTVIAPLRNLDDLFLFRCGWENCFEDNFPSFFPNLKRVYFVLGHKVTANLLLKVFQIKSISEVGCGSFEWDTTVSEKSEIRSVLDVLQSTGLTENDKSFVLAKEGDGKEWVGKKGSLDLSQEEIFKNFQFYHIYSDYALFRS